MLRLTSDHACSPLSCGCKRLAPCEVLIHMASLWCRRNRHFPFNSSHNGFDTSKESSSESVMSSVFYNVKFYCYSALVRSMAQKTLSLKRQFIAYSSSKWGRPPMEAPGASQMVEGSRRKHGQEVFCGSLKKNWWDKISRLQMGSLLQQALGCRDCLQLSDTWPQDDWQEQGNNGWECESPSKAGKEACGVFTSWVGWHGCEKQSLWEKTSHGMAVSPGSAKPQMSKHQNYRK